MSSILKFKKIIKLMLLFLLASTILAFIGLYQEQKISYFDDELETIKSEKKLVKYYQQGMSTSYSTSLTIKLNALSSYKTESNEIKDYNLCIKYIQIGRKSGDIPYLLVDYKKFTNQQFYDLNAFSNIEILHNEFKDWYVKNKESDPCLKAENIEFVEIVSDKLLDAYLFFYDNLSLVALDLMEKEKNILQRSLKISEVSSFLYFLTFIILVFATTLIMVIDFKSQRGQDE